MASIQWKEEFCIGIAPIDAQHRAIFEKMLSLENGIEKRDPWHVQQFFIADLTTTLKFHLAVEESLLEIVGYPKLEVHRREHDHLGKAIIELEQKVRHSNHVNSLLDFFQDWFVRHVLGNDREYAAYLKDRLQAFQPPT